ncbi:hypothetical protein [Burkholderia contaminans]|uniref:hypothetical protein n=1 Tax=Burkholderia contaminans TaxID=488447 RepID=UPI003D66F77A
MILFMGPHDIDVGTDMRVSGLPQDPRQGVPVDTASRTLIGKSGHPMKPRHAMMNRRVF